MTRLAPEALFLPGFDGAGALREPFLAALREYLPARGVSYPNRPLGSLDAYRRHAASQRSARGPTILVAESFSGLVAARWASSDARIEAVVLCGCFARNPVGVAASLGACLPGLVRFGAGFLRPPANDPDPERLQWARQLSSALGCLEDEVIGERLRIIAEADSRSELRALALPVVLLQFDGDLVIGPRARRELEEVCHNAQVVRIPGPHFAIEIRPRQCAEALGPRLRSIMTTGA